MSKKVLFVFHSSSIGGGSWCLLEILRHLDRNRFDPIVLLSSEGPLVERIRSLSIPLIIDSKIPVFPFYANNQFRGIIRLVLFLLMYPFGFLRFYTRCKSISPDVVYLNSSAQVLLSIPSKLSGINNVIFHNREHWEFHGLSKLKYFLCRLTIRYFVDAIFSITECSVNSIGFPEKSYVVRDWPSFDDETTFDVRQSLGINPGKFLILLTGGLQAIKGTREMLQALEIMTMRNRVSIVVLGCDKRITLRLKTLLKKTLHLSSYADDVYLLVAKYPQVILLPSTLQMKSYMQQADAFVAPFVMPHASKAALEAQLMKCPVVLFDCEQAREYAKSGETGFIVARGDVRSLAKALDELVLHRHKAEQYGKSGNMKVKEQFNPVQSMKIIMQIIDQ